jgi:hypothetical protein
MLRIINVITGRDIELITDKSNILGTFFGGIYGQKRITKLCDYSSNWSESVHKEMLYRNGLQKCMIISLLCSLALPCKFKYLEEIQI